MSAVAAVIPQSMECSRCNDTRVVWSQTLKANVRCPRCTVRPMRHDSTGLRELTAQEARRIREAEEILRRAWFTPPENLRNPGIIRDPKLRAVSRVMQRWAVGHGSGLPPDDEHDRQSRPPPLDPVTQTKVDDIINDAPDETRWFLCEWYRSEVPCRVMAQERGMSSRTVYRRHEIHLEWLREQFLNSKHRDLVLMCLIHGA